jgi:hypothetical protein
MRLPKGSPTTLAEEGRLTLQCPDLSLGPHQGQDYPDEWFIPVRYCADIACGREEGFTYLSRIGYMQLYHDLKLAFGKRSCGRGTTWAEFEQHALDFLDEVERKGRKKFKKLDAIAKADPTKYNIRKRDELAEYLKRV